MKIILIYPPLGSNGQKFRSMPIAPASLEYLAGLTLKVRPNTVVELVDANLDDFHPDLVQADLIGFSVLTPQAPWAYHTADRLRKLGIPVVLGGMHVSLLPEEAAAHADALVLGEAEQVWGNLLEDVENSTLKPVYCGEPSSLVTLPQPRTDLLSGKYKFGSFFTTRGCPHTCDYCCVPQCFGSKVRLRPIPEVVAEVAASTRKFLFNIDDNIWGYDISRSIELFRELAQNVRGKYWFGCCHLGSLDHPRSGEMLNLARRSGLTSVMVGWESIQPTQLDTIKKLRAAGIDVSLFVMVGGLHQTRKDFEEVLRLCDQLDISAQPIITIPLPKTGIYEEYKPHFLPEYGWDHYNGLRAVFRHPTMSPEELEQAYSTLLSEINSLPRILRRLSKISLIGFPGAHIMSFMFQYMKHRAFQQQSGTLFKKHTFHC